MKTLFIEAKSQTNISKSLLDKLKIPKKIALVSTIQQLHVLNEIKDYLEQKGTKVIIGGQVIGCNVINALKVKEDVDAILYIGSGEFHPVEVARKTGKKLIKSPNADNEGTTQIAIRKIIVRHHNENPITPFISGICPCVDGGLGDNANFSVGLLKIRCLAPFFIDFFSASLL